MKPKILVVDDMTENIQIILSILEMNNSDSLLYQTTKPESVEGLLKKLDIDLIISDWDMPVMDGIELLKRLKKNPETKHIPVIMATGIMTSSKHLKIALEAGAMDYIQKPVDEVELTARVNSALSLVYSQRTLLATKDNELLDNTLSLVRNNEFNIQLTKKMEIILELSKNKRIRELAGEVINDIESKIRADSFKRFDASFNSVHEDFYKNILSDFPELTQNDLKLCAYLKLGLNSKDIAAIMFIHRNSVKTARSRLRKKMNLERDINLQTFLSQF